MSQRYDKAKVERVRLLLTRSESLLADPMKQSVDGLWRQDVVAIRYVFDRLVKELGIHSARPTPAPSAKRPERRSDE